MTSLTRTVTAEAFESVASGQLGFTNMVDYGITLPELASGTTPPPQGARFDLTLEGQLTGPITGKMIATDYINVRADGRFELNMFGQITTTDGAQISFEGHGVSVHKSDGTEGVRMSVKLVTQSSEYAWVNGVTFIAEGIVDSAANTLAMSLLR
ncbi:DUF3237 family protein [Acaryochloris marina]|uniref:DUF3237 family protein n=1 Tax=Acaryochloris marina TaxID=155978 RepID=UPI001BAFCBF0|nr:DUF3237 family protein [Acaryochloris marina]QUY42807.1 DUF3237 family protein [Acaryochloris marina S15]